MENRRQRCIILTVVWGSYHGPGITLSAFLTGFRVDSSEKQGAYSHDSRDNHWVLLWTPVVSMLGLDQCNKDSTSQPLKSRDILIRPKVTRVSWASNNLSQT